ncbi:MAG: MerR family transcriptional regulator [Bacteroidota bacterium]
MNAFTIKDLENLSGIKAHTIRIWEQRYAFLKPERTQTNIRYYNNEELKVILNVALLNKYGFKISHIDKMKNGDLIEKVMGLNQLQAQHERTVNEMIGYMIDLDVEKLEESLDDFIATRGIEKAITQIIFPFLEKLGLLWVTNHIKPAQEHLVSNIIRQKIIVGIEGIKTVARLDKSILLFLPETEHHELGLLFISYLLKARGVKVWYLGADLPINDLDFIIKSKKPDMIYTHLTSVIHNFNFEKFLQKLGLIAGNLPVIVSGPMTQNYKKKEPENITIKRSLAEVMEFISGI